MGARLVAAAFVYWSHLPDRPFRLLTHMALTCKDASPQPTYYAGRGALAGALGLHDDDSGRHAVKRALRVLKDSGAISIAYHGHVDHRSEYQLHVLKQLTEGGTSEAPSGGTSAAPLPPERGYTSVRKGGTPAAPLGTELQEGQLQENTRKNSLTTEGEYRPRGRTSEPRTFPSADLILQRAAAAAKKAAS